MKYTLDGAFRETRPDFARTDHVLTRLQHYGLLWNIQRKGTPSLLVNSINYEKAFDSVDRATLWMLMRHYGIPEKLVNLVKSSYDGTYCQVFHEGQLTD